MFRTLFILFTCCMLSGCTVITLTYFRNFTNEPVEIWFLPDESKDSHSYPGSYTAPTHFFYSKAIEPIKWRIWKQMKDSIPILYRDKTSIITVPAQSTAWLPPGVFGGTIYIKQAAKMDTIWLDRIEGSRGFRHKGGGFPISSILYYDHE